MKKGIMLTLLTLPFLMCGCNNEGTTGGNSGKDPIVINDDEHYIVDVKILTWPTKTEYYNGEEIDLSGLTLEVTWEDGYVEVVDGKYAIPDSNLYTEGESSIGFSYGDFSFTFNLTGTIELEGIGIFTAPARTRYIVGETFIPNGLSVKKVSNNAFFGDEIEFDYSPKTPLTKDVKNIVISSVINNVTYNVNQPITVSEGFVIEAEDTTVVGGEIATSGKVVQYASGGAMTRNFKKDGSMTFTLSAEDDCVADLYLVGSSALVSVYSNDGMPLVIEDMILDNLFSLYLNDTLVPLVENCKFDGATFDVADFKNFANWTDVYLAELNLTKGDNTVKFVFKENTYKNADNSPASPFYDKMMVTGEGVRVKEEQKVVSSITLSGGKTNYTVGDEFVKPTVTANYSNGKSEVVETATFSGYNMGVVGTYTVTVSYTEDGQTVTTTYQITVVSPNLIDPDITKTIKVEAEQMDITNATKAGNTTEHPGYANSGVSQHYSDHAFVKNFFTTSVLKTDFNLSKAATGTLKLCASTTSTEIEVIANNILKVYVNGTQLKVADTVKLAKNSTAWLVQTMDFGSANFVQGKNTIEIKFITNTESLFFDYIEVNF